ncbi:Eco57I restriction-modification methylase domain-containing protein [Helicobacter pylori]|uniref:type IIG restriction enzyme/methyltransferase n=1 Tax=Helicobacter pylori TaxID=210 RepID=UPI000573C510|nr:Eco57I restriction-modification methylase domain-containing protein [Helicobacter pylori]KHL84410.1 restriction endonuclease [Helicobacter pylori]MCQ2823283.1 Eco57I restriction-modification methylase domain-containing protein [Helicobacter pylori]
MDYKKLDLPNINYPSKEQLEAFKTAFDAFLETNPQENENHQNDAFNDLLKGVFKYKVKPTKRIDSAILNDNDKVEVIIEFKALKNPNEFIKKGDLNVKAFHESLFYYLIERKNGNNNLKHLILATIKELYIIDANEFEVFNKDKEIENAFKNCHDRKGNDTRTEAFYDVCQKRLNELDRSLKYHHIPLKKENLALIYQALSPNFLLKIPKYSDANTLNKDFYEELLYILGLEEQNDKGKILIKPSRTQNSLSDVLKKQYKDLDDEEVMALLIAWNNRILFLRLLESLLISFKHFKDRFLTIGNFKDFNALNTLFFEVLAKKNSERSLNKEDKILEKIPYLNSSLFDKTPLELKGYEIRLLDNKKLELYKNSVLKKHEEYQKQKDLPLLEYLFEFLRVYDFTTTPKDIKDNQNKSESRLINPSVLGLVFEKLNGYKEGSFYTPSFITSYMCKESITPIVLDKFNQTYNIECEKLKELKNYFKDNYSYKEGKRKEYLNTLLTLRICDPAVGSGHFLVSALNEMVLIAYELGLIASLYRHELRLENDEIIIHTPEDKVFKYTIPHSENDPHHQIQKELFELKKDIIENCLFGVDINPNSCEITKLRLWIELLKYSYYIFEKGKNTNNLETLPNIDINIKCANSLISRFNLNDDLKKIPNIKQKIQEYKDLVAQYKDPNPLYPLNKQDLINKIQDLKNTFSLTLKDPKTKAELEKAIEKHIKKYNFFALDDKSLLDGLNYFIPSLFGTLKLSPKEEEEAFASYGRIRALRKKLDDALSGREYQNAFEWRFEFPEVLDDEGDFLGFDCIIGNPPYIDYRKIDEKTKIFLSKFSSVYKKSKEGSIFVYFIERASKLIIKHGLISFINPIAYLCKPTDHGIRDYIDKNLKITMLIDLSNIKIFESASTYTCINIFKRENKKNEILFLRSDDLNELSSNKDDFLKIPDVNIEHISIFLDPISRHIAERFKTQLGGFCKIFCGLSKTGFRSDVINTNSEKSVYFLESSDIYRYYVNDFGKKFLKRIDDYFSQEKQEIFEQQDIIFMTRMTNQIRCVVVPLGVYGGKVNILYDFRIDRFLILGVLNSKLMTYFYKKKFFPTHMQGGAFGFDTLSVEALPIPQITKSNKPTADKITDGAKQILVLKEKDPKANTQRLEKEIDALVYQLYHLTDEEIKIIENGQ